MPEREMLRFTVFEREFGHCAIYLVQAASFKEALLSYAVLQLGAEVQSDGTVIAWGTNVYSHPLAMIEAQCKSHEKFNELEWDEKNDKLLNGSSWEIRALHPRYLAGTSEEIFCSAEPWTLGWYIEQCKPEFRKKHPRSRARAFVWYLKDGPLITFYHRQNRTKTLPIEIIARYLIRWPPDNVGEDVVEEWNGTYDDIVDQMNIQ